MEMPGLFAARRLASMGLNAAKTDSGKLLLKAEVTLARENRPGAKETPAVPQNVTVVLIGETAVAVKWWWEFSAKTWCASARAG